MKGLSGYFTETKMHPQSSKTGWHRGNYLIKSFYGDESPLLFMDELFERRKNLNQKH